jgi:hypothetical protein
MDAESFQHGSKQARKRVCAGKANQQSPQGKPHPFSDYQPRDPAVLRPQRHADSNLMRALRHTVSDDSMDSHRRQNQRQAGEEPE